MCYVLLRRLIGSHGANQPGSWLSETGQMPDRYIYNQHSLPLCKAYLETLQHAAEDGDYPLAE